MVMTHFWNREFTDKFELAAPTSCFFGKIDELEPFNQWQYPICNKVCPGYDKPNPLVQAWNNFEYMKIKELFDSYLLNEGKEL